MLEQNPAFGYAKFTLGRSAMAAGDVETARGAFDALGSEGGTGSSLAPIGTADLEMVLGRYAAAIDVLTPAIEASENPFEKAAMLVALAEADLARGESDQARRRSPGGGRTQQARERTLSRRPGAALRRRRE